MLVVENRHHDSGELGVGHVREGTVVVCPRNTENFGSVAGNGGMKIGTNVPARAFEVWRDERTHVGGDIAWSWEWRRAECKQQRCRRNDYCVRPSASARRQNTALPWYNSLISIA